MLIGLTFYPFIPFLLCFWHVGNVFLFYLNKQLDKFLEGLARPEKC